MLPGTCKLHLCKTKKLKAMVHLEQVISSRITREQNKMLAILSKKFNSTKSELVRSILSDFIQKKEIQINKK